MSETTTTIAADTAAATPPREKLTKKAITADHPTWCPGCGDFAVLAAFYKVLEKRQLDHEKIVTLAGIGCSSRFPYFVNGHGAHYIHGRAVPLASGISLARPDLHIFLFGGDGDGFSIGGNHLDHGARKNINMTYFIMDNFVYGLTKKQTSPTSPIGFKSKTDPTGAIDQPVNPMKKLIAGGATFIARTHATQVKHMMEMIERAFDHQGFSVIECLSECVEFFPDVFDPADPKKGGSFEVIQEKKWDNTPEDELRHDVTDELAAYKLAQLPVPRRLRRLLPKRQTDKEFSRKEMDRKQSRENRQRLRLGASPKNVRSNEVKSWMHVSSFILPNSYFPREVLVVLLALLVPAFFAPTATAGERSVTAAEANGTYRDVKGSSEIRILALGHGKLKVQLALIYEYQSGEGRMANLGDASGEATIENDIAVFVPEEAGDCKITMTFLPNGKLKVEQQGEECGFGHNVRAEGTFRKISSREPKFDDA